MINKKADYLMSQETFLFIYKMFLVVLISVFIIIFVMAFFYKEYDIRQFEGSILISKVADCYIQSGEANLIDFSKTPNEKCRIYAGDDYFVDIEFLEGFPEPKCEDLKGEWKQIDKCGKDYDVTRYVSDKEQLKNYDISNNWKCCIKNEDMKNEKTKVLMNLKDGLRDGGIYSSDVRIFCEVSFEKNPRGSYENACVRNKLFFNLVSEENGIIKKIPVSILIKSGFKKRI